MIKTIQRPLACRNAHCGTICSPDDASFLGNPCDCYRYERRDDLYMTKSISVDKLKQARDEIIQNYRQLDGNDPWALVLHTNKTLEIIDKLIAESENNNDNK